MGFGHDSNVLVMTAIFLGVTRLRIAGVKFQVRMNGCEDILPDSRGSICNRPTSATEQQQ